MSSSFLTNSSATSLPLSSGQSAVSQVASSRNKAASGTDVPEPPLSAKTSVSSVGTATAPENGSSIDNASSVVASVQTSVSLPTHGTITSTVEVSSSIIATPTAISSSSVSAERPVTHTGGEGSPTIISNSSASSVVEPSSESHTEPLRSQSSAPVSSPIPTVFSSSSIPPQVSASGIESSTALPTSSAVSSPSGHILTTQKRPAQTPPSDDSQSDTMPSSTARATESSTSQPSHSTGPASGSSETLPLTDSTSAAQQTSGSAPTQPGKAPVVPTPSTTSSSHVSASSHSQSAAPRSSSSSPPSSSSPSVGPSSTPKPSNTSPAGGVLKGSTTPVVSSHSPSLPSTSTPDRGDDNDEVSSPPPTPAPQPVTSAAPTEAGQGAGQAVSITPASRLPFSEVEPSQPTTIVVGLSSSANSIPSLSSLSVVSEKPAFRGQANAQTPTTTSTVTDHPDTTLTSPIFFSTTNALGRVSLSEPPIFTSIGVTTLSNGELISVTHIVANPTGVWGVNDNNAVSKGFFNNTGAVAGVFLAVGIITAIIGAAACYIISRNRRRRRIRQSISRPMPQLPFPDNPFQDPRDAPSPTQMRYASGSSDRNLVGTGLGVNSSHNRDQPQRNLLDDEFSDESGSSPSATIYTTPPRAREFDDNMPGGLGLHNINGTDALGLAGVGANGKSSGKSAYNGPFSDLSTIPVRAPVNVHGRKKSLGGVNIAITTEEKRDSFRVPAPIFHPTPISVNAHPTPVHEKRGSLQSDRSSPSIYPASELPPVAEDDLPPTPPSPPPSLPAPIMPTPRIPMLRRPLASGVPPVSPQDASAPFSLPPPPRPPKSPPVPPRNPLRASNSLKVKTQVSSYEPLTPPASSISSSSNNDHPSPSTSIEDNRLSNPFSDLAQIHPVDILKPNIGRGDGDGVGPTNIAGVGAGGGARSPSGNVLERPVKAKDTFYTRRKGLELRPSASVEWKN